MYNIKHNRNIGHWTEGRKMNPKNLFFILQSCSGRSKKPIFRFLVFYIKKKGNIVIVLLKK